MFASEIRKEELVKYAFEDEFNVDNITKFLAKHTNKELSEHKKNQSLTPESFDPTTVMNLNY